MVKTREDFIHEIGDMEAVVAMDRYKECVEQIYGDELCQLQINRNIDPRISKYEVSIGIHNSECEDYFITSILSMYCDAEANIDPKLFITDFHYFDKRYLTSDPRVYDWVY